MQGSVHTYDTDAHGGSVLLDDGREVAFDARALAGSGLRGLRVGQRLSLEMVQDGAETVRIDRAWIVGIGDSEVIN